MRLIDMTYNDMKKIMIGLKMDDLVEIMAIISFFAIAITFKELDFDEIKSLMYSNFLEYK